MGQDRAPAYWAVLPARVRYDKDLRPNAKLLYAEITALADATGFCWASNEYLGQLFGLKIRAVRALISQLADKGYLTVEVVRDPETHEVKQRRIWVDGPLIFPLENEPENGETSGTKTPDPSGTKMPDPSGTKMPVEQSKVNFNNTPYSPPEGDGVSEGDKRIKRRNKSVPEHRPEAFDRFWELYPRHADKQKAVRAWDTLQPDDGLLDIMAAALEAQKKSPMWRRGIGIPYPSTWLNGARWEDDVETAAGGGDIPQERQWADDPEVW